MSKISIKLTRTLFKGGTNFPGKVALKLDKDILKQVAKDYKVIFVTGTNGKTTTTSLIANILRADNKNVITNASGANMYTGIVTCFVDNYSFTKKNSGEKYAVIEVDEANLKFLTPYIEPESICITNLFRDQLDRYGEVHTTLEKILEGVEKVPLAKLILNGDESLLGTLPVPNTSEYFGFEKEFGTSTTDINADSKFCKVCQAAYEYNFVTYAHLGSYYCPSCGYARPSLTYKIDDVIEQTADGSTVSINGNEVFINQSGVYNIYNALSAYAVTSDLGVKPSVIKHSLESSESSFGRQETLRIGDKDVKIILVKNPAGYNQALNTISLDKSDIDLAFLLNDNYADGRDISWLWDVDFEQLSSLSVGDVLVGGIRKYDMAIRLKIAGLNPDTFVMNDDFETLVSNIKGSKNSKVYILATYTAMTSFRKHLHNEGYIEKLW